MGCDSPLKGWRNPSTGGIQFRRDGAREKMEVGCGQCLGCRLDYSRMWAMRIVHESTLHEHNGGNCFVTLTYRDPKDCTPTQLKHGFHVPNDWSLHKRHMTLFLKRLRKYFGEQTIRYFYAGEYGRKCKHGIDVERVGCPLCNCGRPHYHACLFNCSFPDLVAYESDGGVTRYTSPTLESIWKYGFVDVGDLNFASASYTARYILKKIKGPRGPEYYCTYDLDGVVTYIEPEYVTMSRGRPCDEHDTIDRDCPNCEGGIGMKWFMTYKGDVFPSDEVPVPGHGVMKGVPRYYDDIMKEMDPKGFEEIQKIRREYMKAHEDEYTPGRLLSKHICKKARVNEQQRNL